MTATSWQKSKKTFKKDFTKRSKLVILIKLIP